MNKDFIPYEQSLALKELGFNEKCYGYYTNNKEYFYFDVDDLSSAYTKNIDNLIVNSVDGLECTAPLYQQAFRWFREEHDLYHAITIADLGKFETGSPDFQSAIYSKDPVVITNIDKCNTHEEAELECLKKLIEIVKEKL